MSNKYILRKWLTKDNHSSSYVMCHYDPHCLNPDYSVFIRFGDCHGVITLRFINKIKNIKTLITIINNILMVIKGKKKSYTFGNGIIKNRITKIKNKEEDESLVISRYIIGNKPIKEIQIHKDKFTCLDEEWLDKLTILDKTLNDFKEYLKNIVTT